MTGKRIVTNLEELLLTEAPGLKLTFHKHVMSMGLPPRVIFPAETVITFKGLAHNNHCAVLEYDIGDGNVQRESPLLLFFLKSHRAIIWRE